MEVIDDGTVFFLGIRSHTLPPTGKSSLYPEQVLELSLINSTHCNQEVLHYLSLGSSFSVSSDTSSGCV
jgi:hypothetical protein